MYRLKHILAQINAMKFIRCLSFVRNKLRARHIYGAAGCNLRDETMLGKMFRLVFVVIAKAQELDLIKLNSTEVKSHA